MSKNLFAVLLALLIAGAQAFAQSSVTGKVTDEAGEPLVGVNVLIKGTTSGTTTNFDGYYTLSNVKQGTVLVFTSIGFNNQEISVGTSQVINVILKSDSNYLNEVVVVGYGTQKKKDLTGSITSVDGKALAVQAQGTVTRSLEGQVPGLQISALDGQPGLDVGVRIRGIGTASQNNSNALIIIDGAPAAEGVNVLASLNSKDIESLTVLKDAASTALYGSRGANGVILITTKKGREGKTKISFEARWGVNTLGSNGKVDKIGNNNPGEYYEYVWKSIYNSVYYGYDSQKTKLSDSEARTFASQHLFDYTGSMTSFSRNKLGNWMLYNVPGATYTATGSGTNGSSTMSGAYLVNENGSLNPDAKLLYRGDTYQDDLFSARFRQEYNVSASGATDKIDYFVSLGALSDPSYIEWSNFKRYSVRSNVNANITKWLKVGANIGYAYRNTRSQATRWGRNPGYVSQNIFMWTNVMSPLVQMYAHDQNGDFMYDTDGNKIVHYNMNNQGYGSTYSPLGHVDPTTSYNLEKFFNQSVYRQVYNDLNMKGYARASFLSYFSGEINMSYDKYYESLTRFYNTESAGAMMGTAIGSAILRQKKEYSYMDIQQLLNYNQDIGLHHVDAMLGHEYYQYDYEQLNGGGSYTLIDDFTGYVNFLATSSYSTFGNTIGGSLDKYAMESYFGRANYIYNDKYYVSASLRRDGSSKFKKKENRWGTFWSIGGGWRISNEPFMESTKTWLDELKIRASYGIIGNQNGIGYYSGYQTWSYGGSNWTSGQRTNPGTTTLSKGNWVNDGLTWEKVHTTDAGIDFGFLNYKLTGALDFYNKNTVNAIFDKNVSYLSAGQTSLAMNTAGIRSRGIELDLTYNILNTDDWSVSVSTNGTHYKTILTKIPEGAGSDALGGCYTASADSWSLAGSGGSSGYEFLRGVGKPYYNFYLYRYGGVAGNPGKDYYNGSVLNDASVLGRALYWHKVTADDVKANTYAGKSEGDDVLVTSTSLASRYELGDVTPKWIGGFSTNVRFKNLDLSVMFAYQLGGKFFSMEYGSGENGQYQSSGNIGYSISSELRNNTWSADNTSAYFPMQIYGTSGNDGNCLGSWNMTDMAVFNASYLSLKNITLGYTFPDKIIKKAGISSMRIFASADNTWLLYGHSGIDPRWSLTGGFSVGAYSYAYMSTYTFGVDLNF